jgi:hypothetical protein
MLKMKALIDSNSICVFKHYALLWVIMVDIRNDAGQSNSVENGLIIVALPRFEIRICFREYRICRIIRIYL